MIHTVKGFGVVNEAEPDVFLELSCFFYDLADVGDLISGSSVLNVMPQIWWWERLKTGGEGDDRGWDGWMASLTWWTWIWASSGSWWWQGSLACCTPWSCKELDMTEQLNWTELSQITNLKAVQDWDTPKWQPTPVFLPGKSQGQRSLVGYSSWGWENQTQLRD